MRWLNYDQRFCLGNRLCAFSKVTYFVGKFNDGFSCRTDFKFYAEMLVIVKLFCICFLYLVTISGQFSFEMFLNMWIVF